MQTAQVKYDIISWITRLNDNELIMKLYNLMETQETTEKTIKGVIPPRRKGSLTEAFGIWADDAPFNETNYRDELWETEKNVW